MSDRGRRGGETFALASWHACEYGFWKAVMELLTENGKVDVTFLCETFQV